MQQDTELTKEQTSILRKVELLLRHADGTQNLEEKATYMQRAQDLLLAHNLDADLVGSGADSAVREEQKVRGGFYKFQEELWGAVADLNFVYHWVGGEFVQKKVRGRDGEYTRVLWQKAHRLVGRRHNIVATKVMAQYLEQSVERATMDFIHGDNSMRFSNWAVSFRKGIVSDLVNRIYERRREQMAEEKRKQQEAAEAAARAGAAGVSTGREVSIASLAQSEQDANIDFVLGKPGWSAQKRAERAAAAERARVALEEHAKWARENPEEARRQEEQRRKEEERRDARRSGRSRAAPTDNTDRSAFYMGRQAGQKIGLDVQAGTTKVSGVLG